MGRFFSFSYRRCYGPTGGGGGVNWRLRLANNKYRLIDGMYNLFLDTVLDENSDLSSFYKPSSAVAAENIKKNLKRIAPLRIYALDRKIACSSRWFDELHAKFHFTSDDVLVFHDFESSYAFANSEIQSGNAHWVYHQQGSLYSEIQSFDGVNSEALKRKYQGIFERAVTAVGDLRFPSEGAKDGLISTDPSTEPLVRRHSTGEALYNGFTLPDEDSLQAPGEAARKALHELDGFDGIVFITVANMNHAKAVERIPPVIASLKATASGEVKWIVVGDGIKADEVSTGIRDSGIGDDVIWIRDYIGHDDILRLLLRADVYVLLQRVSIFDYATIEAMACGNALLLSPTGGNLEVLKDGHNGRFVESEESILINPDLFRFDRASLDAMKSFSSNYEQQSFSEYAFLKRYSDLSGQY